MPATESRGGGQHAAAEVARAWRVLDTVEDPEIPGVGIVDLGIVRGLTLAQDHLRVELTPTYSGCPATDVIAARVDAALRSAGFSDVRIKQVLSPAWTTDWISERGRAQLRANGITPPQYAAATRDAALGPRDGVACAHCGAVHTTLVSEFGSTPCKALYRCRECLEPFEYFKCL